MKILHVYSGVYTGGGILKKMEYFIKNDAANEHEVLFLWYSDLMDRSDDMRAHMDASGITYHYLYHSSFWGNILPLRRFFKNHSYDLLHFYSDSLMVVAKCIQVLGVKTKIVHSLEGPPYYLRYPVKFLINWALSCCHHYVSISNYTTEEYHKHYKRTTRDHIKLVYNAPIGKMNRTLPLNARHGIVCVGQMVDRKQIDVAIMTIKELRDTYSRRIPLYILGDGEDKGKLVALVEAHGLQDLVHFVGVVKDPSPYYDRCRIFVHPAYNEGFGLVIAEAMSMELGVLVANSGALPELVDDGVNGYVLPLRDPIRWAQKINEIYDDEAQLDKLGKAAHEKVDKVFSIENHVKGYDEFYNHALNSK
jgi:glycosyltransferase involved in cell wall biosynthesis